MGLFDLFGKKRGPTSGTIYTLTATIHPLRLPAHTNEYAELEIEVRNDFEKELLTSIVVEAPKPLGFDRSALSQQREVRLGNLAPGETKRFTVPLWSTQRTPPGDYRVKIYAISHYNNYGYVLNEVRKELIVRAA